MKTTIKQLLTGADNCTHDIARWSWAVATLAIIGIAMWNSRGGIPVPLLEFSEALALNAAAHGGAVYIKRQAEPKGKEDAQTNS